MAVTPNYGWPIPVATDLVKDGYAAIADLGDAIDATVFGLGGGGFVQIGTTQSFTTASTVNVNDVFSAAYKNYKIVINGVASNNSALLMRMRVGGADNTSSNYRYQRFLSSSEPSSQNSGSTNTTSFTIASLQTQLRGVVQIDMFNPFETTNTTYTGNGFGLDSTSLVYLIGGNLSVTTSYTGFSIIPASGTITGNVSIFGIEVN